ncbi:hypothetical protein ACJRO7_009131 [Eucalyptus globulus]|uniref:Uncharacterized protein n=1 Tax=Eucalyptus globulus TaxID=34317 RepID=A0ABD3ITA6_EUCGL
MARDEGSVGHLGEGSRSGGDWRVLGATVMLLVLGAECGELLVEVLQAAGESVDEGRASVAKASCRTSAAVVSVRDAAGVGGDERKRLAKANNSRSAALSSGSGAAVVGWAVLGGVRQRVAGSGIDCG